jgi:conjugative transfer signal peptidase TraF
LEYAARKKKHNSQKRDGKGRFRKLSKYVIALPRDSVTIEPTGLWVNGRVVDSRAPERVDRHGRALAAIPNGRYRLGENEVWLYSSASHSWDSRYFGPVKMRDIAGAAQPLLILPLTIE